MKSTSVNGSVASMFAYHPQGEIDIEIVSALHPPQAYFAVHPGLTVQSRASPLTHGNWFFSFDPSLVSTAILNIGFSCALTYI